MAVEVHEIQKAGKNNKPFRFSEPVTDEALNQMLEEGRESKRKAKAEAQR